MSAFFSALPTVEADKIIRLMGMYRSDPRSDKIDLGVGVYRTAEGTTPVFDAVQRAERTIWETQQTKSYTAIAGDPAFHRALGDLVLGAGADWSRLAAISAPGGTGALRKGAELIQRSRPDAVVWLPDPTWVNHEPVMLAAGLRVRSYRFLDIATGIVDRDAMRADLRAVGPDDVILLHGCCHNPTGIDLAPEDWTWLADHCAKTGALPFVDMAYQGFAHGIEEDAAGLRLLVNTLPEVLAAVSCSKNFGLYRDRAGLLLALCDGADARTLAQGMMERLNRLTYAFPPDHGTRIVSTVLADPALRESWRNELNGMRARLGTLRKGFADALRDASGSDRFHFIASGNGMFSVLPATLGQVRDLRERHGIYLIEDGRLNVAGLPEDKLGDIARAVVHCGI